MENPESSGCYSLFCSVVLFISVQFDLYLSLYKSDFRAVISKVYLQRNWIVFGTVRLVSFFLLLNDYLINSNLDFDDVKAKLDKLVKINQVKIVGQISQTPAENQQCPPLNMEYPLSASYGFDNCSSEIYSISSSLGWCI